MQTYEIFELAKQKFREQNYELALKYLKKCKTDKSLYDDCLFEIIKIYFEQKKYKKVISFSDSHLKKIKNKKIKDNIKIFISKSYKFLNNVIKSIKTLDSIKSRSIKATDEFYMERLDCSYSRINPFFRVNEFSGNIKRLKREFVKIKNLVPQNKKQFFYILRISNFFNNYSFTKKVITKYQKKFDYIDEFYDNAILSECEIANKK